MKRSKNLNAYLEAWKILVKEGEEHINQIMNDRTLSPYGRSEKAKAIEYNLEVQRQEAMKLWKKEWDLIKEEYKPVGKSETADRMAIMTTLMTVGSEMNAQMLTDLLEPIKKDVSALRIVKPIIEKQGIKSEFEATDAYKLLNAANKLETYLKEAEALSNKMVDEQDTFKFAISKEYMNRYLAEAEQQLDIVRELEG